MLVAERRSCADVGWTGVAPLPCSLGRGDTVESPDHAPSFSFGSLGGGSKRAYRPGMTPDVMAASFSFYSGFEKRALNLEPGQQIRLRLEHDLEAGSVHCEVSAPDGSLLLRLGESSIDEGSFQAAVVGKYPVRIIADNASGSYRLSLLGS